jgi:hypothetical protein
MIEAVAGDIEASGKEISMEIIAISADGLCLLAA